MKTLKSIMLGLALVAVCSAANATTHIAPVKLTHTVAGKLSKNDVLNIYMNAAIHGKMENNEDVLASDVQFNIKRGDHTITANRTQMLAYLKGNENIEQDCKTTTTTVEDADDHVVVKIVMQYAGYTRTNLVTITNYSYGWLITKVD